MFRFILMSIFCCLVLPAQAEQLIVSDADDNELTVKVYPADSDLLVIWVVDHEKRREMFEQLLVDVNAAGIEIWRVNLLRDYFLTRSNENQRTLPGDGVLALIKAAHEQTDKRILLVGYDRMPLAIMRGARLWQQSEPTDSRVAGAVFFYPNLFGPSPIAGEDPVLDPIVDVATLPMVIYQPDSGYLRWRIKEMMQRLWQAGSQAFVYLVPEVRDWFFMGGENDRGRGVADANARIPEQLKGLSKLMASLPRNEQAVKALMPEEKQRQSKQLVSFKQAKPAPGFELTDELGAPYSWSQYDGKVTLVNFWATWCPPCVEEIPSLNALQAHFQDEDFEIVSINFRETAEQLEKFTSKIPVDFPVLMDYDGKTSLAWKVFSFPSSFLVDKNGQIRHSINLAIDWNSEEVHGVIDSILNE